MALAGIISAQLVWQKFVNDFSTHIPAPIQPHEVTKTCVGSKTVIGVSNEF
jgi:hypothetical protein